MGSAGALEAIATNDQHLDFFVFFFFATFLAVFFDMTG